MTLGRSLWGGKQNAEVHKKLFSQKSSMLHLFMSKSALVLAAAIKWSGGRTGTSKIQSECY